jgi:P27 family predicted phage terminase small subunit
MAGKRGPAAKPVLRVLKTGNPGHRSKEKLEGQVVFPPGAPSEPDWSVWFPGADAKVTGNTDEAKAQRAAVADLRQAIEVCRQTWSSVVSVLDSQGFLATVDGAALTDLCVSQARLVLLERDISAVGVAVEGERGAQKNPSVTAVNQYRTHLRWLWSQFYLTPAARARGNGGGSGDGEDDDPFDK